MNNPTQGWSEAYSRERMGESTQTFIRHVKEYFTNLPLATKATLAIPIAIALIDQLLTVLGLLPSFIISHWLALNVADVLQRWQVHRLLFYPLASPGLSLLLTNYLLLIPYLATMERKKGTFPVASALFLLTVLPGIAYTASVALITYTSLRPDISLQHYVCKGLSGWAVSLSVWSMRSELEEGELRDQMLFGVIRIPGHLMPALIIAFYMFLVPDTSLILHLYAAGIAYLYATYFHGVQSTPFEDTFRRMENNRWLRHVVGHRNYNSIDSAGAYLPISTADTMPNPILPSAGPSSSTSFPGQGRRLGSS